MIDYDIQRCSRRCAATERELKDGETCFSVLIPEGAAVVRRDYSAEAWQGPPENAIGWWKTIIIDPNAGRPHWAPNDVMLNYFERLLDDPCAGAPAQLPGAKPDCRNSCAMGLNESHVGSSAETTKDHVFAWLTGLGISNGRKGMTA